MKKEEEGRRDVRVEANNYNQEAKRRDDDTGYVIREVGVRTLC